MGVGGGYRFGEGLLGQKVLGLERDENSEGAGLGRIVSLEGAGLEGCQPGMDTGLGRDAHSEDAGLGRGDGLGGMLV